MATSIDTLVAVRKKAQDLVNQYNTNPAAVASTLLSSQISALVTALSDEASARASAIAIVTAAMNG